MSEGDLWASVKQQVITGEQSELSKLMVWIGAQMERSQPREAHSSPPEIE